VQEQAEDVAALLGAVDATPALLVGDGFGALVVLELLVRRPALARAAVLADPPLFAFVPAATPALADERTLLEQGLRDGGPPAAVRAWLAGTGIAADDARAARAVAAARGFFADYAGQSSWSPSRGELRAVGVPLMVVTGPATPPHVVEAAEAVTRLVPGAQRTDDGDVVAAALALEARG
jgi:pimeloyl-ACP methyl ester carboxylesterase